MLLQQLVNGLTLGAVYTLLALSFSVVVGVLGVLNLAVADLFMIGAYLAITALTHGFALPIALAFGLAGGAAISVLIDKIGYEPLRNAPVEAPMLSTLGFSIILQNLATNIWGSDPLQLSDDALDGQFVFAGLAIGKVQVTVIAVTITLVAATAFIIQRTSYGRALRAVAENRDVARLLGVFSSRVTLTAFVLSGALAGVAGSLIALHYAVVTPYIGVELGLKAIAVMVVGGTGQIWGVLLAGPLVGVAEVFTVAYAGAQWRDVVVYGGLILTLVVRPQGLLGLAGVDRGRRL